MNNKLRLVHRKTQYGRKQQPFSTTNWRHRDDKHLETAIKACRIEQVRSAKLTNKPIAAGMDWVTVANMVSKLIGKTTQKFTLETELLNITYVLRWIEYRAGLAEVICDITFTPNVRQQSEKWNEEELEKAKEVVIENPKLSETKQKEKNSETLGRSVQRVYVSNSNLTQHFYSC